MRLELIDGPAAGEYHIKSPTAGKRIRAMTSPDRNDILGSYDKLQPGEQVHCYRFVRGEHRLDRDRKERSGAWALYEYVEPTELVVFSDGGVTSNPGPAACAAVALWRHNGQFICEASEALEQATSNQAEYRGLMLGVKLAKLCGATHVEFRTDSELMARQLAQYAVLAAGRPSTYEVRDPKLVELHNKVVPDLDDFTEWRVVVVPRTQNRRADWLVNQRLRPESRKGRAAEPAPGE